MENYFEEVNMKVDSMTDEEFNNILIKSGLEKCPEYKLEKVSSFTGYISGDYEYFCFAIEENDFKKFENNIDEDLLGFLGNPFHSNYFSLYPDRLMPKLDKNKKYKFEIIVRATPVE